MKKIFITAFAVSTLLFAEAQTLTTPQSSTTQTIKQNFGLSFIELTYSRPGVKERKIFGDLVPFGKLWRTGANTANIITFGDTVFINGTKIAPGKYGLFSIPDKNSWALIVSKQLNVTSPEAYKQDQDVVKVDVKPMNLNEKMETLTMQFANINPGSCDLQILWDNTAVSLPITTDTEGKMKVQIDQMMKMDNRPYYNTAVYYINNGKDLNQALTWLNKAIELEPDVLRNHYQRANVLAKMGKKEEAKTAAKKGIEMARAQKNDNFEKMYETLLAEINK